MSDSLTGVGRFPGFSIMSRLVSAGGTFVPEVDSGRACLGTPSYLSSCKILAKSDNLQPSYSDFIIKEGRRPPYWMFEETFPHAEGPIFYLHTKFGKDMLSGGGDMPQK